MAIIILNENKGCGFYYDGEIYDEEIPATKHRSWDYHPLLRDREVEYAKLYSRGLSLREAAPPSLVGEYKEQVQRMKAIQKSLKTAKISVTDNCLVDLVPTRFMLDYCGVQEKIVNHVLDTTPKPNDYEFLVGVSEIIDDISHRSLNLSQAIPEFIDPRLSARWRELQKKSPYIKYNLFAAKTGRLGLYKNGFPILNLDKRFHSILRPNNDWLVEMDFNAMEYRVLLHLSGATQPDIDIHRWNGERIFKGITDRGELKKEAFAWLFNPKADNKLAERYYDREGVVLKYWDGHRVENEFGFVIENVDQHHALNYIIQSTAASIFLRQLIRVYDRLRGMKSYIAFGVHDSIVLDIVDEEKYIIPELVRIFEDTPFGRFMAGVSAGHDYGNMRKIA